MERRICECVRCGQTKPHIAKGFCENCYRKSRRGFRTKKTAWTPERREAMRQRMLGAGNNNYKGGRWTRPDGYVFVLLQDDHPHVGMAHKIDNSWYVLEHRLLVAERLGRDLTAEEVVHHENEDPSDNRLENLRLFANQSLHAAAHKPNGGRYFGSALAI